MSVANKWCVAVFKFKPDQIKTALPDFYHFVRVLDHVKSGHFLIRDRIDDKVIFSFRVLVDPKQKRLVKSKTTYKLETLFSSDKFTVKPASGTSCRNMSRGSWRRGLQTMG